MCCTDAFSITAGHSLTIDTEDVKAHHGIAGAETSAYIPTHITQPGTPTDEEDEYTTPPQSPTLAAKAPNRHVQMGPPVRNPEALDNLLERAKPKRKLSESSADEEQSPKFLKTPYGRQPRELDQDVPDWKSQNRPRSLFSISAPNVPAENTSFGSTLTSAATSFSTVFSGGSSRTTSTTNISFTTDVTEPDDVSYPGLAPSLGPKVAPNSSATIGSSENEVSLKASMAHESFGERLSQPMNDLFFEFSEEPEAHVDQGDYPGDNEHPTIAEPNDRDRNTDASPGKSRIIQHQIRDLPNHGLFIHDLPPAMEKAPFIVRRECCRVALENKIHPEEVMADYDPAFSDYEKFWDAIERNPKCSKVRRRGPIKGWLAAENDFEGFNFKGKLTINTKNVGSAFNLQLEPSQMEASCRFERAFGSDRFLYLSVPPLEPKLLPNHFKSQVEHLQKGYQEWLLGEHSFLGRKWEVFHLAPQKRDKRAGQRSKDEDRGQRVILFATAGCDILSKNDFSKGLRDPAYHSKYSEATIAEVYNWFMPLELNAKQPFCKAYARLDLGLSRTVPTLTFKPSQLRLKNDTLADGTPEDTRFNDPAIPSDKYGIPTERAVMNDGCAQISVGAARLVWKMVKKAGAIPSVFQARIGGAKGMWMLSAPATTEDPEHLAIWIDITKSQLKFEPHDEDLDDRTFNGNRLTFEIVGYSSHHRASELHYLFIPIMIDRGVSRNKFVGLMNERLNFERDQLLELLPEPRRLRKWVNDQGSMQEERVRDGGAPIWQAGLPKPLPEKIIFLLESGFSPLTSPFLARSFHRFLDLQLTRIQEKLSIPLGRATNIYGVADPLSILKPGEVHVHFSSSFVDDMTGETYPFLDNRELLVGRQPALRPSDMQKVRAVFKWELAHLVDVVVFPAQGTYPLAGKLQGGDYDGDTFWLCWEPDLVGPFKNAPAPTEPPSPADYGIEVERRTLGEVIGPDGLTGVNAFREESFKFKSAPAFLGICTNFHESLCYSENCINSPGINAITNVHDLLVDSSKQGYKFSYDAWRIFLHSHPHITNQNPRQPAYKMAIKQSQGALETSARRKFKQKKWTYNAANALDYLYFEIVVPHTEETLRQVDEAFAKADGSDPNLQSLYDKLSTNLDHEIKGELQQLNEALTSPYNLWNTLLNRKDDAINKDDYNTCLERCYASYQAILPVNRMNLSTRFWTEQLIPGPFTYWELIKASALATKYPQKGPFVFHMAGKELAYLKAQSCKNARILTWEMYGGLKPRKVKALLRERGGMDGEEASDYESAAEDADGAEDESWE